MTLQKGCQVYTSYRINHNHSLRLWINRVNQVTATASLEDETSTVLFADVPLDEVWPVGPGHLWCKHAPAGECSIARNILIARS